MATDAIKGGREDNNRPLSHPPFSLSKKNTCAGESAGARLVLYNERLGQSVTRRRIISHIKPEFDSDIAGDIHDPIFIGIKDDRLHRTRLDAENEVEIVGRGDLFNGCIDAGEDGAEQI